MLFGPAPVINVPSTPEMQRWIDERSGWREKASTRELPASGEQTLLARYFSVGPRASTLARAGARPGRPPDYVFDFGNFEGVALKKMFLRKTVASKPSTNRATGEDFWQHGPDYIKWLAGDEFDWQFPKHTLMYLELKASIGRPLELSNSMWLLPDLRRAAAAFDEYMKDAFPWGSTSTCWASTRSTSTCRASTRWASTRRELDPLLRALGFQALGFQALGFQALDLDVLGFDALDALGFQALGFQALDLDVLGFDALDVDVPGFDAGLRRSPSSTSARFRALGFQALGFQALGFQALDLDVLGFDALDVDVPGFDALGFDALASTSALPGAGFQALGFQALGFQALDLDVLGFDALDVDVPGFDALGFDALGFGR
ncbi:hypothetical protein JL720_8963 [Aureococcus anophagefferens]|nr:hypothetical protein JL720_8963 [Aureococcus anophagefferens]